MFILDTKTVSKSLKTGDPTLGRHFQQSPPNTLFVSSIVAAELHYGIVKKGLETSKMGRLVDVFLANVEILPWTKLTAKCFAQLRTNAEAKGVTVDMVDLMIATHAKEESNLTLVTNDRSLLRLKPLIKVVDWTK
jgi:tRNA(fMet)-specific endonuclease VapC